MGWDTKPSHYQQIWPCKYSYNLCFLLSTHLGCSSGAGGKNHCPEGDTEPTCVMAACNIVLHQIDPTVYVFMALVRLWHSQHSVRRTGFYWSWVAQQIVPKIFWPFLCKLGELWPQQVVPQARVSATGLEADGPPDATLTHRLALIATADH